MIQKRSEKIDKINETFEKAKNLPYMTRTERLEYIKELQQINEELKNSKELIDKFSKRYPITDESGKYTGDYLKILIGWSAFYNKFENVVNSREINALKNEKYKIDNIQNEIKKYYSNAIENCKDNKIKRNMEAGMKNLNRFSEYVNYISDLVEIKLKDKEMNAVLSKKENSYIFWLLPTEKANEIVVETSKKIIQELESIKSENATKAKEIVRKIGKIFS